MTRRIKHTSQEPAAAPVPQEDIACESVRLARLKMFYEIAHGIRTFRILRHGRPVACVVRADAARTDLPTVEAKALWSETGLWPATLRAVCEERKPITIIRYGKPAATIVPA